MNYASNENIMSLYNKLLEKGLSEDDIHERIIAYYDRIDKFNNGEIKEESMSINYFINDYNRKIKKIVKSPECIEYGSTNLYYTMDLDKCMLQGIVDEALNTLQDNEIEVLKYRYFDDLTLKETGKRHRGLSGNRISQIEKKALRKLRHPSKSRKFSDFIIHRKNWYTKSRQCIVVESPSSGKVLTKVPGEVYDRIKNELDELEDTINTIRYSLKQHKEKLTDIERSISRSSLEEKMEMAVYAQVVKTIKTKKYYKRYLELLHDDDIKINNNEKMVENAKLSIRNRIGWICEKYPVEIFDREFLSTESDPIVVLLYLDELLSEPRPLMTICFKCDINELRVKAKKLYDKPINKEYLELNNKIEQRTREIEDEVSKDIEAYKEELNAEYKEIEECIKPIRKLLNEYNNEYNRLKSILSLGKE